MTEAPRRDLGDLLGPEALAAVLAVALWGAAIFGPSLLAANGVPAASPTPSPASGRSPTPSVEALDRASLAAATELDRQFAESAAALSAELAAPPIDNGAIASILRDMNVRLRVAAEVTDRLAASPATAPIAGDLRSVYDQMDEANAATLEAGLQNVPAYEHGAERIIALVGELSPLQARIDAILATGVDPAAPAASPSTPVSSPQASTSANPSLEASPSPPPSPSPRPSPTVAPSPSAALPSPDLSGNELSDAGFEDAAGSAWRLAVEPPAEAVLERDIADAAAGQASARVTIEVGSGSRSAIALEQGEAALVAGKRYLVGISARAAMPREIRVQLASVTGETYGTRLFTVGPDWTRLEFQFTAIVGDAAAIFEVDLGRSTATAWFDDAYLGPPKTPVP